MTGSSNATIDPDVKIPAAVRAASARADELYKTLRDNPEGVEVEGATPAGSGDVERGTTGQGGDGRESDVTSRGNPDLEAKSLSTKTADGEKPADTDRNTAPTQGEGSGDTTPPGEESWEHKYRSIHGRYLRSQDQVRQLGEQVQNLQNVISTMQATGAAPAKSDMPPELSPERLVTDEEIADYGEDFLKVVGKRAREEMAAVIKPYTDRIAQLEGQLEGVTGFVKQDAQQKLHATLTERLPNWREVNTNQDFLNWLSLPDPYSGAIRMNMLKAAYTQGDANRVLAFFKGFLAEEAAVAPAGKEPDQTGTRVPKVPLQNLAAPGRAKTAAAQNAPAEKPIITRAQVAEFYSRVAAGDYRGKDDEKNRFEAEIFAANREGRIR
jgi:hypothetical protein